MRFALLLALACALPAAAQDEPPPPPPPKPAPLAPEQARQKHLKTLRDTTVHFDFKRAQFEDIAIALDKASGVRVRIGKTAMKALKRRRFRMKYVADRRGDQVLTDLAKAAALDVVVTAEGVFFDTPKKIRKLRKKLGLKGKSLRLTGKDVEKMLTTKELSLASTKQPLSEVLEFLAKETGVRFVLVDQDQRETPITLKVTATPLRDLLDQLVAPHGLGWLRQGSVIVLDAADKVAEQKKQKQD